MDDSVTIRDNRNRNEVVLAIETGTRGETAIPAAGIAQLGIDHSGKGLRVYDPGFRNTAGCRSRITFVDGEKGLLAHRGIPIEEIAGKRTFLEAAWLVLNGAFPSSEEASAWEANVNGHRKLDPGVVRLIRTFPRGAHTMGMFVGVTGALSTFYDDIRDVGDRESRTRHVERLVGSVASIGAAVHRNSAGLPPVEPDPDSQFVADFVRTLLGDPDPDPVILSAVDTLFILHVDHEQNCSANVMRSIASGGADPYTAVSGASGALYGPSHGGANEAVLRMIDEIGSVGNVEAYVERARRKELRIMGVGHPVYREYDPRAALIKALAHEVFDRVGRNPQVEIALEIERIVAEDDYFVSRKLNPNVDFYSGLIYRALGLPPEMMTVMFAIPRTVGWLAQWQEMLEDPDFTITRPRQIYVGR